jgi:hypothetical protein
MLADSNSQSTNHQNERGVIVRLKTPPSINTLSVLGVQFQRIYLATMYLYPTDRCNSIKARIHLVSLSVPLARLELLWQMTLNNP